jgi:UDP-glucuronate decarboxylase
MAIGDGRVVSNFIVQALRNEDITIYGDGSQTRSFCFVSDLIDGIQKTVFSPKNIDFPINLGNPNDFSVLELARKVLEITKSKSKIVLKELPSDDPKQRKPDISLAMETLNWNPKVQLDEGILRTSEYFSSILDL